MRKKMKFPTTLILALFFMPMEGGSYIVFNNHSISDSDPELQGTQQKNPSLKIIRIDPTVLFRQEQKGLMQAVDIEIDNTGKMVDGLLQIKFPSNDELSLNLGTIKQGKDNYRFFIPEISATSPVEFKLITGSKVQDRLTMSWVRRKHWEICWTPISHHDLGYTNTIELVKEQYRDIYEDVLSFCEETENYPDEAKFRYSVEGAWSLQYFIERGNKESLEKLSKYIKEGRIDVHAFYGNEITDLDSHEELIRLMYPSFRINKDFGGQIKVGSITDIPGVTWGIPTVLAGAGVKYFFAGLPNYFEWGLDNTRNYVSNPEFLNQIKEKYGEIHSFWDEKKILRPSGKPDAFYWKGPDGAKVLFYYQGSYGCWSPRSYDEIMNELPRMLNNMDSRGNLLSVARYAGHGCSDNTPADIIISKLVKEWNSKWAFPKLIVATSSMFFEKLDEQCKSSKDIRTFSGDLPQTDYSVGATSSARETAINRGTHDQLHSAEKLTTMSYMLLKSNYPSKDIRDAYNNMILYDEHTWGMDNPIGKLQDWAWSEKSNYAFKAAGMTELILSGGRGSTGGNAKSIANSIAFNEEGQHIVVFNTLSFNRNDLVNIPGLFIKEPFDIIDIETGEKVPHQRIKLDSPQSPVPQAAERYARGQFNTPGDGSNHSEGFNLVFVADNVPSMGYKSYRIIEAADSTDGTTSLVLTEKSIENRFFKIMLNPETGTIASILDKELAIELVDKNAPHQVNQMITRWVKDGKEESPKTATIRKGQTGPVYASLVVSTSGAGCPQLTQEIILYDKIKRIDISNRVLKDLTPTQEIYFAFPFRMENPEFRFEGPLSVVKPLRDQFPGSNSNYYSVQHWADVSDGKTGITLSSVDAHMLEFGGLNNSEVSQAHHGVTPLTFGAPFITELSKGYMYSYIMNSNFRTNFQTTQMGDVLFRYSISSHKGNWTEGRPREFGWSAGNPLFAVNVGNSGGNKLSANPAGSPGTLPGSLSICKLDKPNVVLLSLKKAEDDEGIIIRLNETEGRDTEVNITLPATKIIKAYETNLVEVNEKPIDVKGQIIKINITAFGVKTIRIL
jgi:alpha-mannosidase